MGVGPARNAMLDRIEPVDVEFIDLNEALGRILASPIVASRDQPPFRAASMDGYALRAQDAPGTLPVVGESAAGHGFVGSLIAGSAVRISTGAPLPDFADTVIIQENVLRQGDVVIVPGAVRGQHVRKRGYDFSAGAQLLEAGRRLDGVALALVAAAGHGKLAVRKQPRVSILSSGDELGEPGQMLGPFQIFDSATRGIAALVQAWGGTSQRLVVRDDAGVIERAARQGLQDHDLLVVIGGASVGDHDYAKPALLRLGLQMRVDKLALRPGKPTWFGTTPLGPVLGLPGNPASALVCAWLFLRPIIAAMLGQPAEPMFRRAHLSEPLPANGPREHYLRAWLDSDAKGQLHVRAFEEQDSSLLSVFAAANALIRIAPSAPALEPGTLVDVLSLHLGC